jgi:YfiH family protein
MKPVLTYYPLAEGVTAFSTTRHGGVSRGLHGALNINPYCGDSEEAVAANRRLLAEELAVDERRLVLPHQVHGIDCRMVTEELFALPEATRSNMLNGVDSLMTDCRNTCIGVSTADCIPVLLYDPDHHAAAAVHAGWRGTVQGAVRRAVDEMHNRYGCSPQQLKCVVGPGISLARFEVGQEVYDAFAQAGYDMSRIARLESKWHIDLPLCNRMQLVQAGVKPEHVLMTDVCTYDHVDDYFSARRLGQLSGRIYTGILLR